MYMVCQCVYGVVCGHVCLVCGVVYMVCVCVSVSASLVFGEQL